MQEETPLAADDLTYLREGPSDPLDLTWAIILRKQPRWLIGVRGVCRSTDERTIIASVWPHSGAGDSCHVWLAGAAIATPDRGVVYIDCSWH